MLIKPIERLIHEADAAEHLHLHPVILNQLADEGRAPPAMAVNGFGSRFYQESHILAWKTQTTHTSESAYTNGSNAWAAVVWERLTPHKHLREVAATLADAIEIDPEFVAELLRAISDDNHGVLP